ncbi:MerR family DNA-binding transcriptional regulator [Streptomyces sp. NPDC021096]|uniref:MerR family DNA-binding transcriptional regulator n=1 Tax=Streptomyces sp. NPDC021096 TaxID=3154792 RepID=UPI003402F9B5
MLEPHIGVRVKAGRREVGHARIGELAERTGTPRRLLRYYEEQRLLVAGRSAVHLTRRRE